MLARKHPRRTLPRFSAVLALALVPALLVPGLARAVQVWAVAGPEKIRPSAAARATATAQISAARNEFEPFQIVVTGAATSVRATATDLVGPGGTVPHPRLYREAIINLQNPSAPDGATGPFPDALVPDVDEFVHESRNAFPFWVPSGESRMIWADVFVPPGTTPGDYAGTVTVTWSGGSATVPVALHVWPFTLPAVPSLRSAYGFYYGAIPAGHGLSEGDAFSWLRDRYGQMGIDHRISLSTIDDGPSVFDHLSTYYAGEVNGTAPTTLPGGRLTSVRYEGPASLSQWASAARAGGWMDRLFQYTCDEPPMTCAWSDIPARAAQAKAADPSFRTLVTTSIQEADQNGVTSSIDLLVPVINSLDDKPGNGSSWSAQKARYDAFRGGSPLREVWTYQSCMSHGCGSFSSYDTGWPSLMIDASAVRNRAMEWLSFRYGLTGELYYETAMAYSHDAWANQWDFSGNGDGTLFYPGTPTMIGGQTHVPVASIRLAMIREGTEDFEYLKLLSDAGDPPLAHQIADGLFPNAYSTEASPQALMEARARIAGRIVELIGGTGGGGSPGGSGGGTGGSGGGDGSGTIDGGGRTGGSGSTASASSGGCGVGGAAGLVCIAAFAGFVRLTRRRCT
jgi:hypothetical protein